MGKHGHSGNAPKTDLGPAFGKLAPENKADEFQASLDDPHGYAARNFPPGDEAVRQRQYEAVREQQRAQQEARRNQG